MGRKKGIRESGSSASLGAGWWSPEAAKAALLPHNALGAHSRGPRERRVLLDACSAFPGPRARPTARPQDPSARSAVTSYLDTFMLPRRPPGVDDWRTDSS